MAIGASVTMRLGERTLRREVRTGYSYCAANDHRVHVGLGDADGVADVTVRWSDGTRERFDEVPANAITTLRRGNGRPVTDVAPSS